MYYSLYNWIGEHEILQNWKKIFASNPEKGTQKEPQKDINKTRLFDIFSDTHA